MKDVTDLAEVKTLSLANARVLNTDKFAPGDEVFMKHQPTRPFTVLGNMRDPRTGESRVCCCWLGEDANLREAALPEEVLYSDNEQPKLEYGDE